MYSRSPSRRVYVNLSVSAVKRLRDSAAALRSSQNGTWVFLTRRGPLADLTNAGWPFAAPPVLHPHHYLSSVFSFVPRPEVFCSQLPGAAYGTVRGLREGRRWLEVAALGMVV